MKAFEGFKSEASSTKFPMLEAGPYIAVIKDAKVDGDEPDQSLIIRVDITEGEQAGYFTKRYKHEESNGGGKYAVRYKGDYRLRIPNTDNPNSKYPESDLRRFNDAIFRIESSNPGYKWDWNESGLKGKAIGISMQAGEYNGIPYTTIGRLETVDDIRKGLVTVMPPKKPRGTVHTPESMAADDSVPAGFTQIETEVPF